MSANIKVRNLQNTGDPIILPDGTPLSVAQITFELIDYKKKNIASLFDVISGEYIANGIITVTTDENGEFSVPLWPNMRGEFATIYRATVVPLLTEPFYIRVPDGEGDLTLLEAKADLGNLTAQEASLLTIKLNEVAAGAAASLNSANDSAASATTAITNAGIATDKAQEANSYLVTATDQAVIATEQAALAEESAGDATDQAGIATEKAGIATEQAALAIDARDTAIANATAAADSAAATAIDREVCAAQVALATTQAGLATANGAAQVTLATNQATLATANGATQVSLATTQAGIATAQAGTATTQAGIATSKAGEAVATQEAIDESILDLASNLIQTQTIMVQHISFI